MLGTVPTRTRLEREVARAAARLAAFLAASFPHSDGDLADGVAFLETIARSPVHNGRPAARDDDDPLARLVAAFDLSDDEAGLLVLAGLPEEHEGFSAIFRSLHPRGEPYPSVGLAAQLGSAWDRRAFRATVEVGPLAACGAVVVAGDGPLYERSLRPAEGLWPALCGIDAWPAAVRPCRGPIAADGLGEWLDSPSCVRAGVAVKLNSPCTVLLTGDQEDAAFYRGLALVREAGAVPVGVAPLADAGLERLLAVHAAARGQVPVVKVAPPDGPVPPAVPGFADFPGPVVLCGRTGSVAVRGTRPVLAVPVEALSPAARRQTWTRLVPELAAHAADLAARFPLEPAAVAEVAADLRQLADLEDRPPTPVDVAAAVRSRGMLTLAAGVKLVRPRAGFDRLVLPADRLTRLHELLGRMAHRPRVLGEWGFLDGRPGSRGVRVLFVGPPGTGKTLAAEVLACELGVDLLVVDVSRMVSKWLGETEKNLAAAFDAAEQAHASLFFDEADALFGKRTEVADAHDRYANLETAYLLARLERFDGLAVLATNFRQNIDPAFARRLEFVIEFDEPAREERLALWRCHLPAGAPLAADLDLAELAAVYPVAGGLIRNAAVAAGFLAAADGGPIRRTHVVHALRREYEKAGKAFPGSPPARTGPSTR
jgi:hypothetical protein